MSSRFKGGSVRWHGGCEQGRGATRFWTKRFVWASSPWICAVAFAICLAGVRYAAPQRSAVAASGEHHGDVDARGQNYAGDEVCAKCHASIAQTYARTAMARASGPAMQAVIPGEFVHAASGVHYRVYTGNGKAWLAFDRPGDKTVQGTRELLYFIGSGHRGRTYLFSVDGFVFESPINWYAQKKIWDMAPAYQAAREIPFNLPAGPGCLNCHTSGAQSPTPGTVNKYAEPLFAHGGISCERCHGAGQAHITQKGPIVNPAKLPPERRDEVCMQCHLEGNAAVEQPDRRISDFHPGENLFDYIHYYVYADYGAESQRAVSQFEALAQSVCKRKSGDAMSCMSCHDPHSSPSAAERVAYYRGKCLSCHGAAFGAKHHAEQPDCTQCHMPRTVSADVAHTEATDHRILRVAAMPLEGVQARGEAKLVRFPAERPQTENVRDLALAWQSLEKEGNGQAAKEAERYLKIAAAENPDDAAVLSGLGFIELRRGNAEEARKLYERVLAADPVLVDAASNLGVIEAGAGHMERAAVLWEDAFARAPGRSAIGMNLARFFCAAGQADKARSYVTRVMEFNPDLGEAKEFLRRLNGDAASCGSAH